MIPFICINRIIDVLSTGLFIILVACVILQVFARYLLPISLPWTEELARYLYIYVTFLGAAIATREGEHIAITTAIEKAPERAQLCLQLLINLVILGFIGYVLTGAFRMMNLMWHTQTAALSWFTVGYMYMALPIGLSFLVLYLILQTIAIITKLCHAPKRT